MKCWKICCFADLQKHFRRFEQLELWSSGLITDGGMLSFVKDAPLAHVVEKDGPLKISLGFICCI